MHSSLHRFKEIWAVDFEFCVLDGERPSPVCLVAWELRSNRKLRLWHNEFASVPPYSVGPDALFVCYMAAAELSCHLVLGWPRPAFVLDLYVEYKNLTNGDLTFAGLSLLGALAAFGLRVTVS